MDSRFSTITNGKSAQGELMNRSSRIYVAGHRGLVGSAILRLLQQQQYSQLITRTHAELDLTDLDSVRSFFQQERPEYVFLAAAKVGGILANEQYPADFIRENLQIQANVIEQCHLNKVRRLLFLGSSCIYPKLAPQPLKEEYLLTGPLEPTNRPYALAKIAGIEMCWSYNRQYGTQYLAAMPTNLYGPEDNFDLKSSHVIPALIRKTLEAKHAGERSLKVWGSGNPRREFLFNADLADACVHLMSLEDIAFASLLTNDSPPLVNVGMGKDLSIRELAELIMKVADWECELDFDTSMQDGTPRKLLDVSKMITLGWKAATDLEIGLQQTIAAASKRFVPQQI